MTLLELILVFSDPEMPPLEGEDEQEDVVNPTDQQTHEQQGRQTN